MTQQEQIRALAELDGWKNFPEFKKVQCPDGSYMVWGRWINPQGHAHNYWPESEAFAKLPDYLNSRDALQPILERLTGSEIDSVAAHLHSNLKVRTFYEDNRALLTAKPLDIAEAILRATGRWK